jgi:hypothetical protein
MKKHSVEIWREKNLFLAIFVGAKVPRNIAMKLLREDIPSKAALTRALLSNWLDGKWDNLSPAASPSGSVEKISLFYPKRFEAAVKKKCKGIKADKTSVLRALIMAWLNNVIQVKKTKENK